MSRRTDAAAQVAAQTASEAARVLQARSQEARQVEPKAEPKPEPKPEKEESVKPERIDELRKNIPHRKAMEEIDVLSRERRGIKDEEPEKPKQEEQKAEAETPKTEEPAPETKTAEPETPKTVKVKVDGEEFEAPADEVEAAGGVKPYQMLKASENRLKKAQEVLAEAQRNKLDIGQLAQALRPKEPEKPKETDAEFIVARADILRFGTPEEMAKAQIEINQRFQPKQIDTNAITAQAVDRFNHEMAVKEFDKEFQDLTANPLLVKLVDAVRRERIATLQWPVNWNEFYRKIGNEVRSAVGRPSQPASASSTASTPSQPSEKDARKASIVTLPTAAARAEAPKEEKPLSPEEARLEAIRAMKKARGIPVEG